MRRLSEAHVDLVVPVFNESSNLQEFYESCRRAMEAVDVRTWSLLFVDDGSQDDSVATMRAIAEQDKRVRVACLSRNFGKEIALSAGLEMAKGDAVVFLDSDLQHPPSAIPKFLDMWQQGANVVVGIRRASEKRTFVRSLGSRLYHFLNQRFADHTALPSETDFRLLDRRVCDAARQVRERQRLFRGVINWLGFERENLVFESPARLSGKPGYSFRKLWQLAIESFISQSKVPLMFVFYLGCFALCVSVCGLIWMSVAEHLVSPTWHYTIRAKALVFNTALVAILQMSVGIVGLYVAKIYNEVNGRPLYVLKAVFGESAETPEP